MNEVLIQMTCRKGDAPSSVARGYHVLLGARQLLTTRQKGGDALRACPGFHMSRRWRSVLTFEANAVTPNNKTVEYCFLPASFIVSIVATASANARVC
jgi:hypothetical protein